MDDQYLEWAGSWEEEHGESEFEVSINEVFEQEEFFGLNTDNENLFR